MTTDNSKYEEAANEYAATFFQMSTGPGYRSTVKDFLAGASFAEKEKTLEYKLAIETAAILKEQRDEALGKLGSLENRLLSANSDIQSSHKREKEAQIQLSNYANQMDLAKRDRDKALDKLEALEKEIKRSEVR